MGIGGISIWQLLIILVIVVLIFGTKKIKNMGGDLGSAIKNFKSAVSDGEKEGEEKEATEVKKVSDEGEATVVDNTVNSKDDSKNS